MATHPSQLTGLKRGAGPLVSFHGPLPWVTLLFVIYLHYNRCRGCGPPLFCWQRLRDRVTLQHADCQKPLCWLGGCIAAGSGSWRRRARRFTGYAKVEILDEVFLPSARVVVFPELEPFYLVQDNSPIHTSSVLKGWFRQHSEMTLCHPLESPNLNPMGKVCSSTGRIPLRSRTQSSSRRYPSDCGMGAIALQTDASNFGVSGRHSTWTWQRPPS